MGLIPLTVIMLCYVWATVALAMRKDWPGALMCFASALWTAGFIWSVSERS